MTTSSSSSSSKRVAVANDAGSTNADPQEQSNSQPSGGAALDFRPLDEKDVVPLVRSEPSWDAFKVYFNEFVPSQQEQEQQQEQQHEAGIKAAKEGDARTKKAKEQQTASSSKTTDDAINMLELTSDSSWCQPHVAFPTTKSDKQQQQPIRETTATAPFSTSQEPRTASTNVVQTKSTAGTSATSHLDPTGWPRQMSLEESEIDTSTDKMPCRQYDEIDDKDDEDLLAGRGDQEDHHHGYAVLSKEQRIQNYVTRLEGNSSQDDDDDDQDDDNEQQEDENETGDIDQIQYVSHDAEAVEYEDDDYYYAENDSPKKFIAVTSTGTPVLQDTATTAMGNDQHQEMIGFECDFESMTISETNGAFVHVPTSFPSTTAAAAAAAMPTKESSKAADESKDGTKATTTKLKVPLLAPPPEDKLKKWQESKARPMKHLQTTQQQQQQKQQKT